MVAVVPFTWKRLMPSVSMESLSLRFLKPDATRPEWTTMRPWKSEPFMVDTAC